MKNFLLITLLCSVAAHTTILPLPIGALVGSLAGISTVAYDHMQTKNKKQRTMQQYLQSKRCGYLLNDHHWYGALTTSAGILGGLSAYSAAYTAACFMHGMPEHPLQCGWKATRLVRHAGVATGVYGLMLMAPFQLSTLRNKNK